MILLKLRTREDSITKVVDEYTINGRRLTLNLAERQAHERRTMATSYKQDCTSISQLHEKVFKATKTIGHDLLSFREQSATVMEEKQARLHGMHDTLRAVQLEMHNAEVS